MNIDCDWRMVMGHEYEIGLSKWELETPALLVDLNAV
jgi:hypothetical protein